jgi:hypothetical protein
MTGAISATEEAPVPFHAMSNDTASAMLTNRGELVNRAFKAVKHMTMTGRDYLKAQRIVVAANFTDCHACETNGSLRQYRITVRAA